MNIRLIEQLQSIELNEELTFWVGPDNTVHKLGGEEHSEWLQAHNIGRRSYNNITYAISKGYIRGRIQKSALFLAVPYPSAELYDRILRLVRKYEPKQLIVSLVGKDRNSNADFGPLDADTFSELETMENVLAYCKRRGTLFEAEDLFAGPSSEEAAARKKQRAEERSKEATKKFKSIEIGDRVKTESGIMGIVTRKEYGDFVSDPDPMIQIEVDRSILFYPVTSPFWLYMEEICDVYKKRVSESEDLFAGPGEEDLSKRRDTLLKSLKSWKIGMRVQVKPDVDINHPEWIGQINRIYSRADSPIEVLFPPYYAEKEWYSPDELIILPPKVQ